MHNNINLLMNNPEQYIRNSLNNSVSKYTHAFPKAQRFQRTKTLPTQVKYTLPSMISKRACSFGYGNKMSLVIDRCSPPPGAYDSQSIFRKDKKSSSPTFGLSRDTILFGSYLSEVRKKAKQMPAPNNYEIKIPKNRIGGAIPTRSQTQPNQKTKHFPGPGAYNLDTIEMAHPSTFALSTFKNTSSPKYHQSKTIDINHFKHTRKHKFYEVQEKEFGKSKISRFRNASIVNFGKERRLPSIDKWKLAVPGFKYSIFSEFGSNYK